MVRSQFAVSGPNIPGPVNARHKAKIYDIGEILTMGDECGK